MTHLTAPSTTARRPRPAGLTKPLAVAAAGMALLSAAGCGTQAAQPGGPGAASRATQRQAGFAQQFTAEQVARHFHEATGDSLRIDLDRATFDTLSLQHQSTNADLKQDDRYGIFSIFLLHRPESERIYKLDHGRPVTPDAQGIYWTQDDQGGWTAQKPYGNVVLTWTADTRGTDMRFRRLDAILSTLGHPASAVRAKLPASDQSCQARGITPTSKTEGTCRGDDGTTVTIVNRGHELKLPDYAVSVTHTKTGNVVVPFDPYVHPTRAKGEFIAVGLRLRDTGDQPLTSAYQAKLRIGDRFYTQDAQATFTVSDPRAFPVQPGDTTKTVVVFDVPKPAAEQALSQGVVAFPAEQDATTQDASKLGEIRLAHQPGAGPLRGV